MVANVVTYFVTKKYRRWTAPDAIDLAKEEIAGLSKRECIERGLYPEWTAVYRHSLQSFVPSASKKGFRTTNRDRICREISRLVKSHPDKLYIAGELQKIMTEVIEEFKEPSWPVQVPLKPFQDLCRTVSFALSRRAIPRHSSDFLFLECSQDSLKAFVSNRSMMVVARMPAEFHERSRFYIPGLFLTTILSMSGKVLTIAADSGTVRFRADKNEPVSIPKPPPFASFPKAATVRSGGTVLSGPRTAFIDVMSKLKGSSVGVELVMEEDALARKLPPKFLGSGRRGRNEKEYSSADLEWRGEELGIVLDRKVLTKAVRNSPVEKIDITFENETALCCLRASSGDYLVYMIPLTRR